jgi:hypothetical protein
VKPLSDIPFMIFDTDTAEITRARRTGLSLAATSGHLVSSYLELLEKIAALSYTNSRFRLLFRGQRRDYRLNISGEEGERGILYPSILRPVRGCEREGMLDSRFKRLRAAEERLVQALPTPDILSLRVVRWAVLQHYEVCETPLLDVTLSLQCALSFAFGDGSDDNGHLFVLAIPHLSGPVSISTESMTQAIDLAQVCPPKALRPHFQSGILLGDYPEYVDRRQTHKSIGFVANDFSCRLLTKFSLKKLQSWHLEGFVPTESRILFPDRRDEWFPILQGIKAAMTA